MKNKVFFTLVIALMSIYATATEPRLGPGMKYKTIGGVKQNYSEAELKAMLLDESGKYDAVQQKVRELIAPQLKAQGVNTEAIPEEEWVDVYEKCVEQAHLTTDAVTFDIGEMVIYGVNEKGEVAEIKGRKNYPNEKLLIVYFEEVCPSVSGHHQVVLVSAMCGNPMYVKSTHSNDFSTTTDDTDEAASKKRQTTTTTDTDEDGSASAQASAVNNTYLPEQSAPAQTQYQNYGGYQTSYGGYQTSVGSYPTTGGYQSQCSSYQPSCGSGYSFGVGLAFGFLPVPTINNFGGSCGQNYSPPPIQTVNNTYYYDYSDNSYHYTDNSYTDNSYYYNHVHNTTVINPRDPVTPGGGPVNPPNGDGPTATGGPIGTGNRDVRSNFDPLHSVGGKGGRYANETAMVSPRNQKEASTPVVSNSRVETPTVTAPRKENFTFNEVVSPRSNPAQVRTPNVPRGNVGNPRTENLTAFNNDVAQISAVRPRNVVPRGTSFNQNGNGSTAYVQPKRNDGRGSGVKENNAPRQYSETQPKNVQPARTTQQPRSQYRNNPQVRQPAQQKVQPAPRQQYQAPRPQYAKQNYSRPAVQSTGMRNTGRPVAMNSGGRRK